MKAAIITIFDQKPNYGNRLQNYATHILMSELGVSAQTISYGGGIHPHIMRMKRFAHRLFGYRFAKDRGFWEYQLDKTLSFHRFNQRYIPSYQIQNISQVRETDVYLLGSDQIWNVNWFEENDIRKDLFFPMCCHPDQKVCISPSFGFDAVPEKWRGFLTERLSRITHLAVREESGAKIVKELTGRDVPVLIDPTLMLKRDRWHELSAKPKKLQLDRPYILAYFLGGCSEQRCREIDAMAKAHDYEVLNMLDGSDAELYSCSPDEFLYLVENSSLVLTDSFHACVFSFLFGRPFVVYDRQGNERNMMGRIETFLQKFDLDRKYRCSSLANDLLECDYGHGYEILEQERTKFLKFIKDAFCIHME